MAVTLICQRFIFKRTTSDPDFTSFRAQLDPQTMLARYTLTTTTVHNAGGSNFNTTKDSMASIAKISSNMHEKPRVTPPPSSRNGCTVALSPSAPKHRLLLLSDALLRFSFLHSPE
ncbi:hypothetical protein Hanom_Chr04g00357621 [Helianthus anomalus]